MPKQPNQIIGSFVLRNEGDGCLTSKYHHGDSRECPFTEACNLITQINAEDVFIGTYRTVWLEDNNNSVTAELTIRRHPQNRRIFDLTWVDRSNNTVIFHGTAMRFDEFLVGTYWD